MILLPWVTSNLGKPHLYGMWWLRSDLVWWFGDCCQILPLLYGLGRQVRIKWKSQRAKRNPIWVSCEHHQPFLHVIEMYANNSMSWELLRKVRGLRNSMYTVNKFIPLTVLSGRASQNVLRRNSFNSESLGLRNAPYFYIVSSWAVC